MLKVIRHEKTAPILFVTPLLTGRKISSQTRTGIQRNKILYSWVSFESGAYHAKNVQSCIDSFKARFRYLPKYIQVLDDDITPGRFMLDRFYAVLSKTPDNEAFTYCPFSYKGHINVSFPAMEFDIERLVRANWMSSNSLYKTSVIEEVGGFVVEDDIQRLSDWAFFLRLYAHGYIGKLCPNTSFVAASSKTDLSAGSDEEYHKTKELVTERFIKPLRREDI
jgi:hypothetical protein